MAEQRCKIAVWQEVFQSVVEVQRRFRAVYGQHYTPDRNTIVATHRKFMETGSVKDKPRSGRPRCGRSEENIETVREALAQSQGKSIRRAAVELNISVTSIQRILRRDLKLYPYKIQIVQKLEPQRILRRDLKLYPYKIQVVQKLEPQDYDCRVEMCETLLHHYERDPLILEHMWFSDEALFHLSGRVNRHNTRIWGTHNPMEIREHERDTPKLVVWCAISSAGLIGSGPQCACAYDPGFGRGVMSATRAVSSLPTFVVDESNHA
ncbi:unnamed protein product [Darwinula stevensoni]|uniref:DUF4817 domain-containing protein n=1 Tax=Darwinula stevensoni TaxID=69355 RepID=A0A7R8WYY8_9CRUS|nr:unnamed protein product [Darwinula stevensoni]CAG0879485.1 unnamed protein product [Darwinula stevensoni]